MTTHKIMHGDCVEQCKMLDDESVELIVTSPPYGSIRDYAGATYDFEGLANELYRVLRVGGVLVWNEADQQKDGSESGSSMRHALYFMDKLGMKMDTHHWVKTSSMPGSFTLPYRRHEFVFAFCKGKWETINKLSYPRSEGTIRRQESAMRTGTKKRDTSDTITNHKFNGVPEDQEVTMGNAWILNGVTSDKRNYNRNHPAVMTPEVAIRAVYCWSNTGDTVLDPFAGSGTTAWASIRQGRNSISIEKNQEYLHMIENSVNRARNAYGLIPDHPLFPNVRRKEVWG